MEIDVIRREGTGANGRGIQKEVQIGKFEK